MEPRTDDALVEDTTASIAAAMARARAAWPAWGEAPIETRLRPLQRLRRLLVERTDQVIAQVVAATGKPAVEALYGDLLPTLELLGWTVEHAAAVLADEERPTPGLIYPASRSHVEQRPLGVVAIYAPWNFPFQLAAVPAVSALAAGNCVLLKASELTPAIGPLLVALCAEAGFPDGVVQAISGGPAVGQALLEARPDKVFFTGSLATGKLVMAAAARHLIPVALELGGKDPALVFADCDVERTVAGVVYGAFANAGQVCVSIERCYVERPLYERFCAAVVAAASRLRAGDGRQASGPGQLDLGPLISARQAALVAGQVADALAKGARLLAGQPGEPGVLVAPIVLADCSHEMAVMREETFGPVLPLMPFDSEEQAIALGNDSVYGLAASVWTKDLERGRRVARRLAAGAVSVNDVLKTIGQPFLPFGGVKGSGFGRYHGPEGLRSFCSPTAVMVCAGRGRAERNWFPYSEAGYRVVRHLLAFRHAGPLALGRRLWSTLFPGRSNHDQ